MKTDLRKINFNKSVTWNMWKQLNINIDNLTAKDKINVTSYYFPEEEQQRLINYLLKNYKKLKFYKQKTKHIIKKQINTEYLAYFPSGVKQ